MADKPDVKTRPLTRDKLASFLKSQELIKAFETLTQDVSVTLPNAIYFASNTGAVLTADVSEDANQFTDVLGMSLPLDANSTYLVNGIFTFQSEADIPSIELGFVLPSGASLSGTYGNSINTEPLTGASAAAGSVIATGPTSIIAGQWLFRNGTTKGDAQLRFRSLLSGYSVTLKSGRCALIAKRI